MTRLSCDGPGLLDAVRAAIINLERFVAEVDALNVFPVPDGDTGSNMLATMRAALAEAERLPIDGRDLEPVADALSRGALAGARGNSGVILSQIVRGMARSATDRRAANGVDLARGLRAGADAAYDSVLTPVEGTILTVVRDAADAAERAADHDPEVEAVLATAVAAASASVARTPALLPVLAEAGVVDSGGQGLFRLLEGTLQVAPAPARAPDIGGVHAHGEPAPATVAPLAVPTPDTHGRGFGYETEYMLAADGDDLDLAVLRAELTPVGESVVVAGDARAARVHIHGRRPDLAIGIGLRAGRLSAIEVRDLDEQAAHHAEGAGVPGATPQPWSQRLALVAVAPAPGLAQAFRAFGANVVEPASSGRPSVGEIAGVVRATGARAVIILPNDRDAHLAAGQASAMTPDVETIVLPTRNAAEGIAAAVAFDAADPIERNTERMEAEAMAVESFTVTIAARDAIVDGVSVQRGQALALDPDDRLLACEDGLLDASVAALSRIAGEELITIYHGAAVAPAVARELADRMGATAPAAEIEVVDGGQRHDRLLVAVE